MNIKWTVREDELLIENDYLYISCNPFKTYQKYINTINPKDIERLEVYPQFIILELGNGIKRGVIPWIMDVTIPVDAVVIHCNCNNPEEVQEGRILKTGYGKFSIPYKDACLDVSLTDRWIVEKEDITNYINQINQKRISSFDVCRTTIDDRWPAIRVGMSTEDHVSTVNGADYLLTLWGDKYAR